MVNVDEFLEHHGVKGQRWGVRRRSGGGSGKKGSSNTARTQFHKAPKRLNDAELNRRIKRMELEKKYNELKAPEKTHGKKYVNELLQNSGKTVVGTAVGTTASFAIGRALKKKFGG